MSINDGIERRKGDAQIELELQKLTQRIDEKILPLIERHDKCIYGEKGDNGLVKAISEVKTGIRVLWLAGVAVIGIAGFVVAVFEHLKK
jgi:hypothetical protein